MNIRAIAKKTIKQAISGVSSSRLLLPLINEVYERLPQRWVKKIEPLLRTPSFDYTWKLYIGEIKYRFRYRKGEPRNVYHFPLSYKKNDPAIRKLEREIHMAINPEKMCLDIGANFGIRSLYYMAHGRKCFLFEPNIICNEITGRFLRENNVSNVIIVPKAVGHMSDRVKLYRSKSTYLTSVYSDYPESCDDYLDSVEQEMISLDEFVSMENLDGMIGILKIDVEGYEKEVCQGAHRLIKSNDLSIIIEISCNGEDRKHIFTNFNSAGYRVFGIHHRGSELKLEPVQHFDSKFLDFLCLRSAALETRLARYIV